MTADIPEQLLTLKTERLTLRKMTLGDAEDIFAYAQDPDVSRYVTWSTHESIADTEKFLCFVLQSYTTATGMDWGIVHDQDRKLIGTCGLFNWNHNHTRAELGYALSKQYWNQGYMTEAVKAVISFGFHVMMLNRIEAICKIENIASAQVLQKVGMELEGTLRQYVFYKGNYWDIKIYSILNPSKDCLFSRAFAP
ncbi:GNAT family protein [Tumidithrix helvetica PCC 7403]|uniref:GNAT family N-acetyltransferase n=1 Tax=Tumidithrix helvetica TaxID=3457545 RepID=UPI003C97209B